MHENSRTSSKGVMFTLWKKVLLSRKLETYSDLQPVEIKIVERSLQSDQS